MWVRETELRNPHLGGLYLPTEPASVMLVAVFFSVGSLFSPPHLSRVLAMLALNSQPSCCSPGVTGITELYSSMLADCLRVHATSATGLEGMVSVSL